MKLTSFIITTIVYTRTKKHQLEKVFNQFSEFFKDSAINANNQENVAENGRVKTKKNGFIGFSGNVSLGKNVLTYSSCRKKYRLQWQKNVDTVVGANERWVHDAILSVTDSLVLWRIELAVRWSCGSSAHGPDRLVQNPDKK